MAVASVIPYLLVVLLMVTILAVIRLWSVLGTLRVTLINLEATRLEATQTLRRMDETAVTTDRLLREEVTPTLQAARSTLKNIEMTTRGLSEATASLRRITGRAESMTDAKRLITAGTALAVGAAQRKSGPSGKRSGSLFSMVAAGLMGLLTSRKTRRNRTSPVAATGAVLPQTVQSTEDQT